MIKVKSLRHVGLFALIIGLSGFPLRAQDAGSRAGQLWKNAQTAFASGNYAQAASSLESVIKLSGASAVWTDRTVVLGFGDDLLAVKINGALVLDAGTVSMSPKADVNQLLPNVWSNFYGGGKGPSYVPGMGSSNGLLKMGPTFHVDAAKPVDMDVLIGDQGGTIAFFLLIQKGGSNYETQPDGTPVLPFFQLNNGLAPTFESNEEHPPYSTFPEPWQMAEP